MAAGPNLWTFCALLLGGLAKEEKGVVCNDRVAVRRERSLSACVPRPLPGADAKDLALCGLARRGAPLQPAGGTCAS